MLEVGIRSIHFIGIMILFSAVFAEHMLITKEMKIAQFKKVAVIDAIYGISALLVLVAGFMLWFSVGNTPEFYTTNWVFHLKLMLFVVVLILSLFPTIFLIKNRKHEGETIVIPGYLIMLIRIELLLLICIPIVATVMAKGLGIN